MSLVKKLEGIEIDIDNIPIDDKKLLKCWRLGRRPDYSSSMGKE